MTLAGTNVIETITIVIIGLPMQPKRLEHYKYFTPIAWALCLGFAGFVGLLALQVNETIHGLETSNLTFEQKFETLETTADTNPSL